MGRCAAQIVVQPSAPFSRPLHGTKAFLALIKLLNLTRSSFIQSCSPYFIIIIIVRCFLLKICWFVKWRKGRLKTPQTGAAACVSCQLVWLQRSGGDAQRLNVVWCEILFGVRRLGVQSVVFAKKRKKKKRNLLRQTLTGVIRTSSCFLLLDARRLRAIKVRLLQRDECVPQALSLTGAGGELQVWVKYREVKKKSQKNIYINKWANQIVWRANREGGNWDWRGRASPRWKMEDGDTGRTRAAAKCGASELDHTVGAGESCMSAALLPPLQTTEQWVGGVDGEQLVSWCLLKVLLVLQLTRACSIRPPSPPLPLTCRSRRGPNISVGVLIWS